MILPEYLETVFIGKPPGGGWPSDFHIITAWNPKRIVSEAQNHEADARLRTLLEQEQFPHFPITGCSADLVHREASWGIIGVPSERAIQIGREYGQNALIEIIEGEAFIVSCETPERQSIGQFQTRVKGT
jgi:Protein of unknown function (DUF3293)